MGPGSSTMEGSPSHSGACWSPWLASPRETQLIVCRAVSWGHDSQIDARLLLHECPGCVGGRISGAGQSGAEASTPSPQLTEQAG